MDFNEQGIEAIRNKEYEKAAEAFMKAIEVEPQNPVGYINVGNVLASMNEIEQAERFFQKAISLDENAGAAFYGLASLYYNAERYEEAARLYEKAMQKGTEDGDLFFMLGKSLERSGNNRIALPYLQRAAEMLPDDLEIRLSYGIALANLEIFQEAEKEFSYILDRDPQHADANYNLGFLYAVSTDRKDDALHHLERAFTANPEHVQARYIYDMIKLGTN